MKNVKFLPFVGKNYEDGFHGKKILVLGHNHYGSEDEAKLNITKNVMDRYFYKPYGTEVWMNTYKKFERALVGKETSNEDSIKIWNSLAFYNFIQTIVADINVKPCAKDYVDAVPAFFEVLNELQPDYVIIWGKDLYNNMPKWENTAMLDVDGFNNPTGTYKLDNGHIVNCINIYHPSSAFSWNYWHMVIENFIN